MAWVLAAFIVALVFIIGGLISSHFERGGFFLEGLGGFMFGVFPGLAGLAVAAVALVVWLIPATQSWAWIPAVVSFGASASMLGVLAWAKLADWYRG